MMLCNIHSCSAETDENRFMTAERIDSFSENLGKGRIFYEKISYSIIFSVDSPALRRIGTGSPEKN